MTFEMPSPSIGALAEAKPGSFWLDDPVRPARLESLRGRGRADVAIVGGGFTGLWAALEAKERDPGRDVVLIEGGRIGWAASGRNGGFLSASLTHGLENGIKRFPDEVVELERQGKANFDDIRAAIERYDIDAEWEERPGVFLARRPHELAWFPEAAKVHEDFGHRSEVLDRQTARARVLDSPLVEGALVMHGGLSLVHPAKLAWGLMKAALDREVRIFERSPVRRIRTDGLSGVVLATETGSAVAQRVVLATNAYPPLVGSIRHYVVPVYDHVLMSEPLSTSQRTAIGWTGREGLSDAANRFHYFRLTADDRILWGGYDATYHFGNRMRRSFEQDEKVHGRLTDSFFETFPALEGIRFTHRWGGVIDTCSRFSAMFGTSHRGRVAYALGYTGLGVGASRFGARTALDMVDGLRTERTQLAMVRRKPIPFPPEPLRSIGIRATVRAYDRLDRTGRPGPWLKLMDRLGLGFQS
jgi:glycine/D-amino acid oxidase-like deaminating enzyme